MKNLRNPKWLLLINTLPIVVLFLLFIGDYNLIKSVLNAESIQLWKSLGLTLGFLGLINLGYTLWLMVKKEDVSAIYGGVSLVCYVYFIYLFGFYSDKIIPFSIPQWMLSGNNFLYVGTFLMPTLVHALFILVVHFTPENTEHQPWKNFLMSLLVPISWYLFSLILLPLWKPVESNFMVHLFVICLIVGTLIFFFFLIRGFFILATKKAYNWQKYQLAWKIPISIVLPLIGLLLNNGILGQGFSIENSGIFGDFNSYWFYGLACLNGLLICLPNVDNKIYRTVLFTGRSITFAYTLYFFLVFLPFLPVSIIAIVAVGTGFLMLTPLLLFVLHINDLANDFTYLEGYFSKNVLRGFSLIGFLTIPLFITSSYLKDKMVLNEALDYIYSPNYSKDNYEIDKTSLQKTLNVVKHHKDRSQGGLWAGKTPYLSAYFNWLTLDNLTLSDAKINTIEKIFFGNTSFELRPTNDPKDDVKITNLSSKSTFDKSQNAWLSWVDLEIKNNDINRFAEYVTTIELPEGSWISDYYLYVGNKKEYGILAEKKAAMWIFSNIRNENKDPGILYYLTGNKVAFRIFPFAEGEVRKTGIQILHKEPITFNLDNHTVKLGNEVETIGSHNYNKTNDPVHYISAKQKQSLKQIKRKPYFHFLLDASPNAKENIADFTKRIEHALETNKALAQSSKISFINSYVKTIPLNNDWQKIYKSQPFEGSFYLDRGLKMALFNAYKHNNATYPVFVVVTDSIEKAVLDQDFSSLKLTFPETNLFFTANQNGVLQAHSLISNPLEPLPNSINYTFDQTVLEYDLSNKKYYLPSNNQASIILKNDLFDMPDNSIKEKNWHSALTMQGKWLSQVLHPETSDKEWLNLVKFSFLSKVMTPVTSYLVVENEAQKAILKKKQEQVLSSHKSLDLNEDTQRMSEPSFILLTALLGLILWYRQKRGCAIK